MVVELVGGFVVACCVRFDGFLYYVDCATEEVGVRRHDGLLGACRESIDGGGRVVVVRVNRGR